MGRRVTKMLAATGLIFCLSSSPVWAITDRTEAEPMTEAIYTPILNALGELETEETLPASSEEETSAEEILIDLITGSPLTPDGNGAVLDDLKDEDAQGKEFYTITTKSGAIYYLIIDKSRTSQNVYFLNAVDEADLADVLPQTEAVPTKSEPQTEAPMPTTAEQTQEASQKKDSTGISVLPMLSVAGVAGVGFWLYRKKKAEEKESVPEFYDDEDEEEENEQEEEKEESK